MNDVHALSGAYAVDALDDIERAQFERHLVECAECRAEVDSLREGAAMLADVAPVAPPAALRDRILAEVATVRPLPPQVVEVRPRRRRFPALVAAAAAVVTLGVGAPIAYQALSSDTPSVDVSATERVLRAADTEKYVQRFDDGSKATVYRSKALGQAVIVTEGMADPGEGKVYELWLDHDGEMVAAGFMPKGPDNTVLLSGDAAAAEGVGITVEPEGGSDEPNLETAVVFAFDA
ncbi:anti-sigma factor [uncultured Nocardioides sp.]|uniref:anti-sigma factor n=1 Tax=uncultured Nocardioides sp. TaxID=198441 RepID=UPI0026206AF2|nr:anti-sigma factor [uncultured Nocardioides sp.]